MTDVLSIALSGLNAASTRAKAAASNIANANTSGARTEDGPQPYIPLDVVQTSEAGSVKAQTVSRDPATTTAYDPEAAYADDQGFVAIPNVDLAQELVDLKQAANTYRANLAVAKVANQMEEELLNRFDKTV